jgi:tetratricopeptide (TPR) repeat protein
LRLVSSAFKPTRCGSSPEYLQAIEGAAEIEYQRGDVRAVGHLNKILQQRPQEPTTHAMLAVFDYKTRNCKDAVLHFQQGYAMVSSQTAALAEYGECLVKLNLPASGVPVFARLLELRPTDRNIRYDLGLVEFLAGNAGDASTTLQPPVEETNPDPDALDLAASVYESRGQTPQAAELLHQAIVLSPGNTEYYLDFASLCFTHPSYQVGVDTLNAGIAYQPRSAPLYLARGILHIQAGHYAEGEADFEKADRIDPSQSFSSEAIGLTQLQKSNLAEALKTVRLRLQAHPNDAFRHYLLAQILIRRGAQVGSPEFKEAVAEGLRAIQNKSDLNLARNLLSGLYLKSGETGRATEQSQLVLKTDPSDQEALYHLIQALKKEGRSSETVELLKRLPSRRASARNTEASQNRYKVVEVDHEGAPNGLAALKTWMPVKSTPCPQFQRNRTLLSYPSLSH